MRRAKAWFVCWGIIATFVVAPASVFGELLIHRQIITNEAALGGLVNLAITPDGSQLYTAADFGGSSTRFTRDASTGVLAADGADVIDSYKTLDMVFSADGRSLYTIGGTGCCDLSITPHVFRREPGSGDLTELALPAAPTYWGLRRLAISPDQRHVYTALTHAKSVQVFSRDLATGELTYIRSYVQGSDGMYSLDYVTSVAVSPDGKHVYATAATTHAVSAFARDQVTGELTLIAAYGNGDAGIIGMQYPLEVEIAPDGAHVYVVQQNGAITVLTRNPATGQLAFVETGAPAAGIIRLRVSPDSLHLYRLTNTYGLTTIDVFARDAATGVLTFVEAHTDGLELGWDPFVTPGGRSLVVSPDGAQLYVAAFFSGNGEVAALNRDPLSGHLTYRGRFDGIEDVDGLHTPHGVLASGDGAHVYVSALGDDSIALFARDQISGELSYRNVWRNDVDGVHGINGAGAMVLTADGAFLYAAGEDGDSIGAFGRDAGSGELTFAAEYTDGLAGIDGLDGVSRLALSPGDTHLYALGANDHALSVFSRDGTTGALTHLETQVDGVGGVDGLGAPADMATPADGRDVYVASVAPDEALAQFRRNAVTGALTYAGKLTLTRPTALAISRDGSDVYALETGIVGHFRRDLSTGALTEMEPTPRDGTSGEIATLVLNADETALYLSLFHGRSLSIFDRDPATGTLRYRLTESEETQGVAGLAQPAAIARSPVGPDLYVVAGNEFQQWGPIENSLAVFREFGCPSSPPPGCRTPARARFDLRYGTTETNRKAQFGWYAGDTTPGAALGDPVTGTTGYALCVYDSRSGSPGLNLELDIPHTGDCRGRNCWRSLPDGGDGKRRARYLDSDLTPDGIRSASLNSGPAGRGLVRVKANGRHLPPLPSAPMVPPVTAVVTNSEGECWAETYTAAAVTQNDGIAFKARTP